MIEAPTRADELRQAMVDRLAAQTALSPLVAAAFRDVPRHLFVPGVELERVYSGDVIVTHGDLRQALSSSSEVRVMAPMLQMLELAPGQRVLEVGAGTGYNAALLDRIVGVDGKITTVELDPTFAAEAREHLASAGHERVHVTCADGWFGDAARAPFDRIVITASSADLSPAWTDQLADGGIIVLPLRFRANAQAIVALRKRGQELVSTRCVAGGFMDLRGAGAGAARPAGAGGLRVVPHELADRVIALLEGTPRAELGPQVDWSTLLLLAIVQDVVTIAREDAPVTFAIYGTGPERLTAIQTTHGAATGQRALLLGYGAAPFDDVRQALERVRGRTSADLRVHAVPTGRGRPEGDLVLERPSFTFGVTLA